MKIQIKWDYRLKWYKTTKGVFKSVLRIQSLFSDPDPGDPKKTRSRSGSYFRYVFDVKQNKYFCMAFSYKI